MSYRFMRLLVFFDLPTESSEDRRNYRNFRKNLIRSGFFMLQESIYCRMFINAASAAFMVESIKKFAPKKGLINTLTVTEKQFAGMEFISGELNTDVIHSDERTVIL